MRLRSRVRTTPEVNVITATEQPPEAPRLPSAEQNRSYGPTAPRTASACMIGDSPAVPAPGTETHAFTGCPPWVKQANKMCR
jgi:hypothetical protein